MKVSDYVASFLHAQHVSHVFELVGGMTVHLIDAIYRQGKIKIVSMHHEQAAAFAADAAGRITGTPGIAMATSGPGATNLLTGIGSCYFDSSPAVFITGQVNRNEQKGNLPVRQLGFQETDIVAMASPITKAAWRVRTPEQVPELLEQAFLLALAGRPGPVLIDIPMDVQRAHIDAPVPLPLDRPGIRGDAIEKIGEMLGELSASRRPLILAGNGIRAARAGELFRGFVNQVQVPVVNSLLAVDCLPYGHPLRVGMIGSYGNRWANLAIGRADFLLVLGSRLDIRQTGADTLGFKGARMIYHVDCESGDVNNRVRGCIPILADLHAFLKTAIGASNGTPDVPRADWSAELAQLRDEWPDIAELLHVPGINPNHLMHELSAHSQSAAAYVVDVGQHQMWAAQSIEISGDQHFLTSGGMGAMGFGLPAAIGASMVLSRQPVVMIAGDGGFQLNLQELQTVAHNRLPVKMVVLNNQCQGMVRQFQQSYLEERYPSTYWGYSAPDFARVAEAYGINSQTVQDPARVEGALDQLWDDPQAPFLLQVMVDTFANAYPKIAFGRPITEMEPLAKPIDVEGT